MKVLLDVIYSFTVVMRHTFLNIEQHHLFMISDIFIFIGDFTFVICNGNVKAVLLVRS